MLILQEKSIAFIIGNFSWKNVVSLCLLKYFTWIVKTYKLLQTSPIKFQSQIFTNPT
jgi:hypothetical protein